MPIGLVQDCDMDTDVAQALFGNYGTSAWKGTKIDDPTEMNWLTLVNVFHLIILTLKHKFVIQFVKNTHILQLMY